MVIFHPQAVALRSDSPVLKNSTARPILMVASKRFRNFRIVCGRLTFASASYLIV
jgi:hypothetical protein